jgi:pyruvate dehydrogenase E1 component
MYCDDEAGFYYLTVGNEGYAMPPMPEGVEEGILRGMYRIRASQHAGPLRAQLLGSGAILNEVLHAAELLETKFDVAADVWSVTSYNELRRDALAVERRNLLRPEGPREAAYVTECLKDSVGVVVAASDYLKSLPDQIAKWIPRRVASLGTDGFGRSDSRTALRDFFEVDARYVALAALAELARDGELSAQRVTEAITELGIDAAKLDPLSC